MALALAEPTAVLRAVIYTRVSQDRAGGRSPEEQEAEARLVCQREGWNVEVVLTDSVGASRHSKGKRSEWERAKALVASGQVDVLVTWEASRAQRDLAAYAELRDMCVKHGVRWSYSGNTFDMADKDDRFRTGLDALLAEREADEVAHRVQRAMRANAAQGRPHGRRLFGYQRVYDPTTGALVGQEPHPEEAEVVRSIFTDYLSGRGIRTIARVLNERGVTTGTGAKWNDAQVRRVLTNVSYISQRVHKGEVVGAGDWPALVEADVFDRAQARLLAKSEGKTRQRSTARLLTGVGRCGVCGGKLHALHDRNGRKFYECRRGFHVARDLVKLDDHVTKKLVERLTAPDLADDSAPVDHEAEAARARVDDLRLQLDAAVDQFASGNLTAATLAKVEARLLPQIAEAEKAARSRVVPMDLDVPEDVAGWWAGLEPEQQREVVNALVSAVIVNKAKRGSRTFDPDTVKVEWRR